MTECELAEGAFEHGGFGWQLGNLANLAEFHLCVRSLGTLAQVVLFLLCSALLCSRREVIKLG